MTYTTDPKDPRLGHGADTEPRPMNEVAQAEREARAARQRERYRKMTPEERQRLYERNEARRQEHLYRIYAYLAVHPCADCGETDVRVLEFDHVRGEKRYNISQMAGSSWQKIVEEIDKCDVVCANCHKRRTWVQLGYRDYRPVSGPG